MNAAKNTLSILQISDLHLLHHSQDKMLGINTEYYFKLILEDAFSIYQGFDLVLVTGDLAQHPCTESYQRIRQELATYDTPSICFPGNHDDWPLMQQIFNSEKASCDKQRLFENWQLICLNSQKLTDPSGLLQATELEFLKHCLETKPKPYAMISVHHHCVPTRSKWLDTMLIENKEELFAILRPFKEVKLIVTGHIHQEMEAEHQGIKILTTPSTCFQFKPESKDFALDHIPPGYRVLNLYDDGSIDSKVHRLNIVQSELHDTTAGYV